MVKNKLTGACFELPTAVDSEVIFDGGSMITETDTAGIITYANRKFREMTGYSNEELVGSPHSLVCHSDMPKIAFKGMWKTIKNGEIWNGLVKNIRKDGQFYWVDVTIQPIIDKDTIVGYIASRKIAEREHIVRMEAQYKDLIVQEVNLNEMDIVHGLFNARPLQATY